MTKPIAEQAVVIGAGMGGLAAAKAVAPYFEKITVLDRDALPDAPQPRAGTPQARHTHVLLAGGCKALEQLFPDVVQDLKEAQGVTLHVGRDLRFERPGYDPFPQRDLGVEMICQSRPLLERICRRRLEEDNKVEIRARSRVTQLIPSPDERGVAGVRFERGEGDTIDIAADLVVDASGRAGPSLALLERIGRKPPAQDEIGIDIAYSTAIFEIPDDPPEWAALNHLPAAPEIGRGGLVVPIEGGRWTVSIGGVHGDAPPGDVEGMRSFARTFRTPTLYDAIATAKSIGEVARFNFPGSVRRHFERMERFPRGLVPIADSLCRFNPVFGQGMSVAAQEAVGLGRLLEALRGNPDPLAGLAESFLSEIQPLLESPWAVAVGDFVYPQTRGERPPDLARRFQYGVGLTRLMFEDPAVHKLGVEVMHLLKPHGLLRNPELVGRVNALMAAAV